MMKQRRLLDGSPTAGKPQNDEEQIVCFVTNRLFSQLIHFFIWTLKCQKVLKDINLCFHQMSETQKHSVCFINVHI